MAGALRYYDYRSDSYAGVFGIRLDRTNGLATVLETGTRICLDKTPQFAGQSPADFRPRIANTFNEGNPRQKRRFVVGNPAAYAELGFSIDSVILAEGYPGDNDAAGAVDRWRVTSLTGEHSGQLPYGNVTSSSLPS